MNPHEWEILHTSEATEEEVRIPILADELETPAPVLRALCRAGVLDWAEAFGADFTLHELFNLIQDKAHEWARKD